MFLGFKGQGWVALIKKHSSFPPLPLCLFGFLHLFYTDRTTPIFVLGEVTTPFLPVHMCNISVLCLGGVCSNMVHWTPLCGVEDLIPHMVALYDGFLFIIRFMHWHMHQLFNGAVHRGLTLDTVHCDIRGAFG